MFLEGLLTGTVNTFLGDYVEAMDTSSLSLGILNGDFMLKNLFIREGAADALDLPVRVLFGNIASLHLKVPWRKLEVEPVVIDMDGLFVIVSPNTNMSYDALEDHEAQKARKQQEIAAAEAERKKNLERTGKPEVAGTTPGSRELSFVEKLVGQAMRNFELHVTNVHIRYEDAYSCPGRMFSIGITLQEFAVERSDASWQRRILAVDEDISLIYKVVKVSSFSVYFDCDTDSLRSRDHDVTLNGLKSLVVDSPSKSDVLYVIEPASLMVRMMLHLRPDLDNFEKPRLDVDLLLENLNMSLASCQMRLLMDTLDTFQNLALEKKYFKYRPYAGRLSARESWYFAYDCVLDDIVKSRRTMWTWSYIRTHRIICHEYMRLWKLKLGGQLSSDDALDIERCETELDVFNIVLVRELAQVEYAGTASEAAKKKSNWFSWLRKSAPVEVTMKKGLTEQQKNDLVKALDFSPDEPDEANMPDEYVAIKAHVELRSIVMQLTDSSAMRVHELESNASMKLQTDTGEVNYERGLHRVAMLQIRNIFVDFGMRPKADAVKALVNIESISITGMESKGNETAPTILSIESSSKKPFVDVIFETNPLDGSCSMNVEVDVEPIVIVFDAKTVYGVLEFVSLLSAIQLTKMEAVANETLEDVGRQTKLSLEKVFAEKKVQIINITVQPIQLIVPYKGAAYKKNYQMLLVHLGMITLKTVNERVNLDDVPNVGTDADDERTMKQLKEKLYDLIAFTLERLQILFVNPGDKWQDALNQDDSNMQLLKPVTLDVHIFKCLVNDIGMPRIRISGTLPQIRFVLTEECFINVVRLAGSIPAPVLPDTKVEEIKLARHVHATTRKPNVRRALHFSHSYNLEGPKQRKNESYTAIMLDLKFTIGEISLSLEQKKDKAAGKEVVRFLIETIAVEMLNRQLDSRLFVCIDRICLQHPQFKVCKEIADWYNYPPNGQETSEGPVVNILSFPKPSDTSQYPITLEILGASKKHPDFVEVFERTMSKITVRVRPAFVLLHQEALLDVVQVVLVLLSQTVERRPKNTTKKHRKRLMKQAGKAVSKNVQQTVVKITENRRKKRISGPETVTLAAVIVLDSFKLAVTVHDRMILDLVLAGLDANVALCYSKIRVNVVLKELAIYSHSPNSLYDKILSFQDEYALRLAASISSMDLEEEDYLDPNNADLSVSLSLSLLTIVFLNKFVMELQTFANNFVLAFQLSATPPDEAADDPTAAVEPLPAPAVIVQQYDPEALGKRLAINLSLKLPLIVVPQSAMSTTALVVDLGVLTVSNEMKTKVGFQSPSGLPAIVDVMRVVLDDLTVIRAQLAELTVTSKCFVLEPLSISVTLARNLSAGWYHGHPSMQIACKIPAVSFKLSQGDYFTVLSVVYGNVKEGVFEPPPRPKPAAPASAVAEDFNQRLSVVAPTNQSAGGGDAPVDQNTQASSASFSRRRSSAARKSVPRMSKTQPSTIGSVANGASVSTLRALPAAAAPTPASAPARAPDVYLDLKATFVLDSLSVELYFGSPKLDAPLVTNQLDKAFMRLEVGAVGVKAEIMSDNSVATFLIVQNLILSDLKPGQDAGFSKGRMIQIRRPSNLNEDQPYNLVDVAFIQDSDFNKDVKLFVNGFYVTLCPEFFVNLGNFLSDGAPKKPPPSPLLVDYIEASAEEEEEEADEVEASAAEEETSCKMHIQLAIVDPEIVLLDDLRKNDPTALVVKLDVSLEVNITPEVQTVIGGVHGLQVFGCIYSPSQIESTKIQILEPLSIDLDSRAARNENHRMNVNINNAVVVLSTTAMQMISAILGTMSQPAPASSAARDIDAMVIPRNMWEPQPVEDFHFWFMHPMYTLQESSANVISKLQSALSGGKDKKDETRVVMNKMKKPASGDTLTLDQFNLTVHLMGNAGRVIIPLLHLQLYIRDVVAMNWTAKLYAKLGLTLEVVYFNEKMTIWEPLIEAVQRGEDNFVPWELGIEVVQDELVIAGGIAEADALFTARPPKMTVNIVASDVLQITVSTATIQMFQRLGQMLSNGDELDLGLRIVHDAAPYVIRNGTGLTLQIDFGVYYKTEAASFGGGIASMLPGDLLRLFKAMPEMTPENEATTSAAKKFTFTVIESGESRELNVHSACQQRSFLLKQRMLDGKQLQITAEVLAMYGFRQITLQSIVQVKSHLPYDVLVFYYSGASRSAEYCGKVPSKDYIHLTCLVAHAVPNVLYFQPDLPGYSMSVTGFQWNNAKAAGIASIKCPSVSGAPLFLSVKTTNENIFFESTKEKSTTLKVIHLYPPIIFRNLLPCTISFQLRNVLAPLVELNPGKYAVMVSGKPGACIIDLSMIYDSALWSGSLRVKERPDEFTTVMFETAPSAGVLRMDLGVHCKLNHGYPILSLFCPYWMINKTDHNLSYKSGKYIVNHRAGLSSTVLFSAFTDGCTTGSKKKCEKVVARPEENPGGDSNDVSIISAKASLAGATISQPQKETKSKNQKAPIITNVSLKINNSEWSSPFSLDTVFAAGVVQCKDKAKGGPVETVGVEVKLAGFGLTSIVKFTTAFVLINEAAFTIRCCESTHNPTWYTVEPGNHAAFWPNQTGSRRLMVATIGDSTVTTKPFNFGSSHSTFLKLDHAYGGIYVQCIVRKNYIRIVFRHYTPSCAPLLLVNLTSNVAVNCHQKGVSEKLVVEPGKAMFYAWQEPAASTRQLVWHSSEYGEHSNDLLQDGAGRCTSRMRRGKHIYWASFLNNGQRVLLVTKSLVLARTVHEVGEREQATLDVVVSLQGFGVSLVNNDWGKEVLYLAIASSNVMWERQAGKRWAAVDKKMSEMLENSYMEYLLALETNLDTEATRILHNNLDVDFSSEPMNLYAPFKGAIRRSFQPAIWVRFRVSAHQIQLHVKIHLFQIDNQLVSATFPTIFSPVMSKESVQNKSMSKPFIELGLLIRKGDHTAGMQFKYLMLLIQEMELKVDLGFLLAVLSVVTNETTDDVIESQTVSFTAELNALGQSLEDEASQSILQLQHHLFDHVNFSPIKLHLTLTLSGDEELSLTDDCNLNFLLFFKSIGIMITEMENVILRLNSYNRKNQYLTMDEFISDIIYHYIQQVLRHIYAVVLGFSILGNPVAVFEDFATGIHDLFYEPYQGAFLGPAEFARGLGMGLRSFVGHTVGGVFGGVSRITGTLGKGVAVMTMDAKYQKKRRLSTNRQVQGVGEGFVRGGRRLAVGVAYGVIGVVSQPIAGAKHAGFGGFVQGVGKGVIGAVALPVSGILDLSTYSTAGIYRVTASLRYAQKLRPARFIGQDGVLRPYVYHDAEGYQLLQETGDGEFSDDWYVGHVVLSDDGDLVLLATDNRVMLTTITKGPTAQRRFCRWVFKWQDLHEAPSLTETAIIIVPKDGKGVAGGVANVEVPEEFHYPAELLVAKMASAMLKTI